jgi:hypothetical protein
MAIAWLVGCAPPTPSSAEAMPTVSMTTIAAAPSTAAPPAPGSGAETLTEATRLLNVAFARWAEHDSVNNCPSEHDSDLRQNPMLAQFRRIAIAASKAGYGHEAAALLDGALELTLQLEHCASVDLARTIVAYAQIGSSTRAAELIVSHRDELTGTIEESEVARVHHIMKRHDRALAILNAERSRLAERVRNRQRPLMASPANAWSYRQLALAYGAIEEQDLAQAVLRELPLGLYELETLMELASRHARAGRFGLARRSLAAAESLIVSAWAERQVAGWDTVTLRNKGGVLTIYESRLGPWLQLSLVYARMGQAKEVERIGRRPGVGKRFTRLMLWVARSQPSGPLPGPLHGVLLTDADWEPEWRIHRELTATVAETLIRSGVDDPWHHQVEDLEEPTELSLVLDSIPKVNVVFGILADHIVSGRPLDPAQRARLANWCETSDVSNWDSW